MLINIALVILTALVMNFIFTKCGLPGILGMIATGIVLGPSVANLIAPNVLELLQELKTAALIVILIRAGLGIQKETLNKIGGPAIRMSFIPCIFEGIAVTAAAYYLLALPFFEAGMLGFIIAAVSPAVVVPQMLELKEGGFGKEKEIPTLILAGASADDIFSITIFTVFTGLASGVSANITHLLVSVPLGIVLGALVGAVIGFVLVWFFKRFHMRDTIKVIIFISIAIIFNYLSELEAIKEVIPIAGLLGIMAIGFVILNKYAVLAKRLSGKFNRIWVLAEIFLFVYLGSQVRIETLNGPVLGVGLLILAIGLTARSFGVLVSLLGSKLNFSEKLFSIIAYIPKATVQAAIGAVPLTMVYDGKMTTMTIESGQVILTIAVLSIVVTAPMGAIGIKLTGKRLLQQN